MQMAVSTAQGSFSTASPRTSQVVQGPIGPMTLPVLVAFELYAVLFFFFLICMVFVLLEVFKLNAFAVCALARLMQVTLVTKGNKMFSQCGLRLLLCSARHVWFSCCLKSSS